MVDKVSEEKRSWMMSRVKGRDTRPEKLVRSTLHSKGYRFRLHCRDLPGTPDIVLPRYKKIVLVHGCFWHQHPGCRRSMRPATNKDFWDSKLDATIKRDSKNIASLRDLGWEILVLWECDIESPNKLDNMLTLFLLD